MKHRHRTAIVGLFVVVLLVAAACGGGKGEEETTATEKPTGAAGELKPAPGFDGTTITLGVITPQTGPAAVIGNPLTAGNQVFFDALNAKGGVAGKYKVKLEIRDSQYQQPVAVQAYAGMKNGVALFVQILGTAINNAILPQLKADKIVAAPASLDAFWVREQNLIPIGAPYQVQAANALAYYVGELGGKGKKVCGLFQADPYGDAGAEGLKAAAKDLGVELGPMPTFKQGDTDFTAQISQLKGCDMVFLTALPVETSRILGTAAQQNFTPQWMAQSPTYVTALSTSPLKDYMAQHFLLVSEGTSWGDTSVPGMKQMLDDVQKYKPDQAPDIYFAFGYAQAWAVSQVLEKAVELGDLSRDGIIKALNSIDKLTFGGLLGDYTWGPPAKRNPPRASSFFKIDPNAPGGLAAVKTNFTSEAAKKLVFSAA